MDTGRRMIWAIVLGSIPVGVFWVSMFVAAAYESVRPVVLPLGNLVLLPGSAAMFLAKWRMLSFESALLLGWILNLIFYMGLAWIVLGFFPKFHHRRN